MWHYGSVHVVERIIFKGRREPSVYLPPRLPMLYSYSPRAMPFMLLSHCGEYSCEYEYLNFAVNSPKNCDWIVNIFISVTPRLSSVLDLSLPISYEYITNAYQRLPMLANALRIANERCQCLRTLYQRYQWLTNAYENRRRMTVFATFAEI